MVSVSAVESPNSFNVTEKISEGGMCQSIHT